VAGGGMGLTHNKQATFARLADLVGFVEPQHAVDVVTAIVGVHRDFGDRTNRKHARLKYVLHEWGLERFREELRARVRFPIAPPRPMPAFAVNDHLGWQAQGDGRWSLGLPIESGRIGDDGDVRLRSGLRAIVEATGAPVRLTPQQNVLVVDIADADRPRVQQIVRDHAIRGVEAISPIERLALACPALPTCGLALTEAERVLPSVRVDIEAALEDAGLPGEPLVLRMTGCPNGCARPYVAELALVGRTGNKYLIYLGGDRVGTRLARPFLDLVPITEIGRTLGPVFRRFKHERTSGEAFGDFCDRVGLDSLKATVTG
jgi:sulfite reductase (ferredoxin)